MFSIKGNRTGPPCAVSVSYTHLDTQASKDAATNLIDQGCTIIVGCSYGYGDALNELANSGDYDDVTFLHFSGPYQNETNMENFFGSMEEARYLSGMAAASVTTVSYTHLQDCWTMGCCWCRR